jgi:hypothetical protein
MSTLYFTTAQLAPNFLADTVDNRYLDIHGLRFPMRLNMLDTPTISPKSLIFHALEIFGIDIPGLHITDQARLLNPA